MAGVCGLTFWMNHLMCAFSCDDWAVKKKSDIFHMPVISHCSEIGEDSIIAALLGGSLNYVLFSHRKNGAQLPNLTVKEICQIKCFYCLLVLDRYLIKWYYSNKLCKRIQAQNRNLRSETNQIDPPPLNVNYQRKKD